jgi:hypothetical protein
MLRFLDIKIDYRDGLVNSAYDPNYPYQFHSKDAPSSISEKRVPAPIYGRLSRNQCRIRSLSGRALLGKECRSAEFWMLGPRQTGGVGILAAENT